MKVKMLFATTAALLTSYQIACAETFIDTTFNQANYTTGFNYNDGAASASASFPGNALQVVVTEPSGDGSQTAAFIGEFNSTFVYSPSAAGAIGSISASVDKTLTASALGMYSNTFRPLIEQDGLFYTALYNPAPVLIGPGSVGPTNFTTGNLTATNFDLINPTTGAVSSDHPNFSGDAITFGVGVLLAGTLVPSQTTFTFQDLSVSVTAAVPEPATWAMMILGFVALGLMALSPEAKRIRA